jgi:hypothetical protein
MARPWEWNFLDWTSHDTPIEWISEGLRRVGNTGENPFFPTRLSAVTATRLSAIVLYINL